MRIWYGGPAQMRVIGEMSWSAANHWTTDVPAGMAAEILCQPGELFEVAKDEPLQHLRGITDEALLELALSGVSNIEDLVALKAEQVKNLSTTLPKLSAWQRQAAGILKHMEE